MRNLFFLLVIVIFSIFQVTILDNFRIFNAKPDLLLISVVMAGLCFEFKWALLLSIFIGILKDTLCINTFGINTLLFPLWALIMIELSKKISVDNNFMRAVFVFIVVISNTIITKSIFLFLNNSVIPLGIFIRTLFFESLYTALIFPLVFKITKPIVLRPKEDLI